MKPEIFIKKLKENDIGPFVGVPCSVFTQVLNYINDNSCIKDYICSSEGEAMGLAAGFALSNKLPVVYMQNDGYGNALNPLSSLQLMYELPALLLISWRAEPSKKDAYQHRIMGDTILKLLNVFSIPYKILDEQNCMAAIVEAKEYMKIKSKPYAFIVKRGFFDLYGSKQVENNLEYSLRVDYLNILYKYIDERDILLGTTGFTGRELEMTTDHIGKFYMMGSMGCLPSIGLSIAIENPKKRIFILDGDGALLMKMGSLSTIGNYTPNNLVHICFDNNSYESTGGQATTSRNTDFANIAKFCGYEEIFSITKTDELDEILNSNKTRNKLSFIHIKIKSGTIEGLQRPDKTPVEMRDALRNSL